MSDERTDRREFVRVPLQTKAEIEINGTIVRSRGPIDVSLGSIRISADCGAFPAGAPCFVRILLTPGGPGAVIEARGIVARCEEDTVVVRFTELDLDGYHHLRQLILYNTEDTEKAEQQFAAHWGLKRKESGEGKE